MSRLTEIEERVKRWRYERTLPVQSQFIREDLREACADIEYLLGVAKAAEAVSETERAGVLPDFMPLYRALHPDPGEEA